MHYLSICAIVKNEAPYIEEWLEFHLLQGVDHFYIYDNGSEDATTKILERYALLGLVTYHTMLDVPCQMKAYHTFLQDYKNDTKWVAFIDADEFLYSGVTRRVSTSLRNMETAAYALKTVSSAMFSGIAVAWTFFGSNGHLIRSPGLVTHRFYRCAAKPGPFVKSIMKANEVEIHECNNPHSFVSRFGTIDEDWNLLHRHNYSVVENPVSRIFKLNHYHTKSKEEAFRRWTGLDPTQGLPRPEPNHKFKIHDLNEKVDLTLFRLSSEVEANIMLREGIK